MLTADHIETYGWQPALRGMRNPMNSWAQADSSFTPPELGYNDARLAEKLVASGPDHGKFLRMIGIAMDITAPLYFWKEYDTYKVGTVADSCSTMHKITAKKFVLSDFSHEHLDPGSKNVLETVIKSLNHWRMEYLKATDPGSKKYAWWQLIQLLPASYNQKRTVTLNYQVARAMYHARRNHKLNEWHQLCEIFEQLPASQLITMEGGDIDDNQAAHERRI